MNGVDDSNIESEKKLAGDGRYNKEREVQCSSPLPTKVKPLRGGFCMSEDGEVIFGPAPWGVAQALLGLPIRKGEKIDN
ncbi:hypothetical protein LIER_33031 [Lithospermum erythrorhizon]|uniref:Uncharacterized protein n=1 Tax=Lithospermum erythrorhizon TaxID=34254 RepID=A0AAV3RVJ1_LITER